MNENNINEIENGAIKTLAIDSQESESIANKEEPSVETLVYTDTCAIPKTKEKTSKIRKISSWQKKIGLVNIITFSLQVFMTILCFIQLFIWAVSIKNTYDKYLDAIVSLDYVNITIILFMVIFAIVLFANIIKNIVYMANKELESCFGVATTIFSFYIFSIFVSKFFNAQDILISNLEFSPILEILLGTVITYAIVRMFMRDFGNRICAVLCGCGAIVISVVMFLCNAGNFAVIITTNTAQNIALSDCSLLNYIHSISNFVFDHDMSSTIESVFLTSALDINIWGFDINFDEKIFVILLQFIPIIVAEILPFTAISMLGYLIHVFVGSNYLQYYNLQICKKISGLMLIASTLSLLSLIFLSSLFESNNIGIDIQINYSNIIMTMLLSLLLIVLTSLPWKIYEMIYNRHFMYNVSEDGY